MPMTLKLIEVMVLLDKPLIKKENISEFEVFGVLHCLGLLMEQDVDNSDEFVSSSYDYYGITLSADSKMLCTDICLLPLAPEEFRSEPVRYFYISEDNKLVAVFFAYCSELKEDVEKHMLVFDSSVEAL